MGNGIEDILLGAVLAIIIAFILGVFYWYHYEFDIPKIDDRWSYSTPLVSIQLSQNQITNGSLEGRSYFMGAGYVHGQLDGHPEIYVYARYYDERGNLVDALIPRSKTSIREDVEEGKEPWIEIYGNYERTATKQEIRDGKVETPGKAENGDDTPQRPCFAKAEDCRDATNKTDNDVEAIVHIPKGAVIPNIDPNTIRR
jgi:hypothetical protein